MASFDEYIAAIDRFLAGASDIDDALFENAVSEAESAIQALQTLELSGELPATTQEESTPDEEAAADAQAEADDLVEEAVGQQVAEVAAAGFCQNEQRISTHACNSLHPAVAFEPAGRRGVFWHDNRDGTWEIYGRILPSQMSARAVREAYEISDVSFRPVVSECSGFSGASGGPTSPSGIIDLSQRCSSDDNAAETVESDLVARLAQGILDVNATSQTVVLSTDADVDFYRLGVQSGTRIRIETGANSEQEFTVQSVLAVNVLDLGYKPTAQSDVAFVFSVLAAEDQCEAMACEFRLSCDLETSMFPDVVADSQGRFHVVWQSKPYGDETRFQLWYSQVYPESVGPRLGCRNRRAHAQGGFAEIPSTTPGAVRVVLSDGSITNYVSTGDVGDYFSYGDSKMTLPTSQSSGTLLTRTGTHSLFLDLGATETEEVITYDYEDPASVTGSEPDPALTTGNGLLGQYFYDGPTRAPSTGAPSTVFDDLRLSRVDSVVNFTWNGSMPFPGARGSFSARWSGQVEAQYTENYKFYLTTDDGGRLWVNGTLYVDMWFDHERMEKSTVDIPMVAGQKYDIRVDYYDIGGRGVAMLEWSSPSTPRQVVPQSALYYEDGVDEEQPDQLPPGAPSTTPVVTTGTTTVTSMSGLWTGVSRSSDREAWDAQASELGITSDPSYVATSTNSIVGAGDFGQRYDFENVGVMFMSPPDKSVRMRHLMMPIYPKFAPRVFPEPQASNQLLVPAPKKPLPPSFIDPVDISRVVSESQVKYEDGPTRFTLEGDATGTIYTNVFVNDPSGEWLRLVFKKEDLEGDYKFILGRLRCDDDPCALLVPKSGATEASSRTYDFVLKIWRGPDYRLDPEQVTSAQVTSEKIYEETFRFEPGENVTIYSFAKDKLTLAAGHMYFATVEPAPNFQIIYQGAAPGNVIWSTTEEGLFEQYFVPWTLPPFRGLFAPIFYDGYLGSITEGNGGGAVSVFEMSKLFDIGDSLQMDYYELENRIMLSKPYIPPRNRPADKFWHGGYTFGGGYSAGQAIPKGKTIYRTGAANPYGLTSIVEFFEWPKIPSYGRWIYHTDDPSEIPIINDFLAARATYEEPPRGTCCWIPIADAPKQTRGTPGELGYSSAIYVLNKIVPATPTLKVSAQGIYSASYDFDSGGVSRNNLELLDGAGEKSPFSDLEKLQGNVPLCVIQESANGFVKGESYVGSHLPGQIVSVSSEGTVVTEPWVTLEDPGTVTGIDHLDGDLFAVTSTGNLWRIASDGSATKVIRAPVGLWGAMVVPNEDRYGGFAGKIISSGVISSDPTGTIYIFDVEAESYERYEVGTMMRAFEIVKANRNLYLLDSGNDALFVAAPENFTDIVGEIIGTSANGQIWLVTWSDDGPVVTEIGSVPTQDEAIKAEDLLFAPDLGATVTEIECNNQYRATLPFQLTTEGDNVNPRMDIDDFDNIWLTWHSNRTGSDEVYVARYDGDCATWSVPTMGGAETRVTNHGLRGASGKFPNVKVDAEGEAHLVWQSTETSDRKADVFYTFSTGGGQRFLNPIKVTDSPVEALMPDLAVNYVGNAERITVVWHDNRFGDFEIMSASKTGATWRSSGQRGGDLRLTAASGDSLFPRIVADKNQNLRVVYHDYRLGQAKPAIFMSSYVTSALEWYSSAQGGKDMLVSHGPSASLHPDIDVDLAGGIGIVWYDDRHALENPDYHEEVYGIYCLREGESIGRPHFQALDPPTYTESWASMSIQDCETGTDIEYTNVPDVCLRITAPGTMFWRAYNEDGILSPWQAFKPGPDLETMIVPWSLTCGNGLKTVCVQVQDEFNVSYPICDNVVLVAPESRFKIDFFKDEALTEPLPKYKSWPITTAGDVYIRITTDEPQVHPPTFDVITRGSHSVFNQEMIAVGESEDKAIGVNETDTEAGAIVEQQGVTGFEADAYRSFKGRFHVYRDDGVFHADGLSRVVVHGGNPCDANKNKSAEETGGNETPP